MQLTRSRACSLRTAGRSTPLPLACPARSLVPPAQRRLVPSSSSEPGSGQTFDFEARAEKAKKIMAELLDPDTFGTRGEAWVAGQLVLCALLAFPPAGLTSFIDTAAVILALGGAAVFSYAAYELGDNLTPLPAPREDAKLVTTGLYGYCRHPIYAGLLVFALGLSVASHSETRLAITAALFWVLNSKVEMEEEGLVAKHGRQYEVYREKTKKFFPYLY
ncbi:hypothetical protein HYH03_006545 [Edaphochlamys debaryana]|uniref:Protein-S-isoprenylcysteine O-methyltransferase n=1 Tax=Edaphochlamys debaryana TaxID=47281 RepID=A0A835Y2F1_9CHLO|nr:hypothetical protein HYH03_006545 [Edaphochlamys debaryana]|eukprot:KAG2495272.1 hypothetical protein HYH03_006545 [Edaphochlamys debaryana]